QMLDGRQHADPRIGPADALDDWHRLVRAAAVADNDEGVFTATVRLQVPNDILDVAGLIQARNNDQHLGARIRPSPRSRWVIGLSFHINVTFSARLTKENLATQSGLELAI